MNPRTGFLTALGAIYAIAFASFGVQATGLVGANGILPASDFLARAYTTLGAAAWWNAPTLFWLNASDVALQAVCWGGVAVAAMVIAGYRVRTALIACYVLHLSLVTVGQDFMSYQWDMLLLEMGFLAIFLNDSPIVLWLFRWLLFRLMFLSGAGKLLSGDHSWRDLTALQFHYWTQPIPNMISWYAALMPSWVHQTCAALLLGIELAAPFLLFAPLKWRLGGGVLIATLQLGILLTGNYTYFNLAAIALCVLLMLEAPLVRPRMADWPLLILIVPLSLGQCYFALTRQMPPLLSTPMRILQPFGIANGYGLFSVMTTSRPEIVLEGSEDGQTWIEYEFRYKPGDVRRRPPQVAPHQPRLDWQMWFAALGTVEENPWFSEFIARLLRGSPEVVDLLARNPFPAKPPRSIRAVLYQYRFTTWAQRGYSEAWWVRERAGVYMPAR